MMNALSPNVSVFAWAWYRAKEFRARFWVGAAVFSLVVALIASRLPLPSHPTSVQNLVASVFAIVGATIMTVFGSYACALVAAPFQQRNALRTQLSESRAAIAAPESSPLPVSEMHADNFREIALQLRQSVWQNGELNYGEDGHTWRRAFNEHFVCLKEIETAFASLEERLHKECAEAGMDTPPWNSEWSFYWLSSTIRFRSVRQLLSTPYDFKWRYSDLRPTPPIWTLKDAYDDHIGRYIVHDDDSAGTRKQAFEELFRIAESWPEASDIQDKWRTGKKAMVELLTAAANTDPITSKCFLCQERLPPRRPTIDRVQSLSDKNGPVGH